MKRRHDMPFGCRIDPVGVQFRLWAPSAHTVELLLDDSPPRPMAEGENGWFTVLARDAAAGSRYRFGIDGELQVPDPASRYQPEDVHGPSEVIDPQDFAWTDGDWRGRPWVEAVLYELHVGTFSPDGDFAGIERRLDYLADLGITAIELMPVAEFPGRRGWGYDGVLPFAPEAAYGRPEDLKRLVQAAHERRLMVFLDVVYNHFGPEGNDLHAYAAPFFTERHRTPWGAANNFDGENSRTVRNFFIQNALYWLEEFHVDGLRLDAVHAVHDDSAKHILVQLAERVRAAFPGRHIHLVLENDANQARYLGPHHYDAQWNDDFHHCWHALLTGETGGYYGDYRDDPLVWLGTALTRGFAYQGEVSGHRHGAPRGEPSGHLPPVRFVTFLQNHDQVGNRAKGERLSVLAPPDAVEAAMAVLLLGPNIPILFMGEEWGSERPFLYFCDFRGHMAAAVRRGRQAEFAAFDDFAELTIPDPNDPTTFEASRLDWEPGSAGVPPASSPHAERLALVRRLLAIRHLEIVPRLPAQGMEAGFSLRPPHLLHAWWHLADATVLHLQANLGPSPTHVDGLPPGRLLYTNHGGFAALGGGGENLPPWTASWVLAQPTDGR